MSSATRHLGPEEIAGYRQRTLAPADLLRVDDHLAGCGACRDRVSDAARATRAVEAIRVSLANAAAASEHPSPEEIAALVDGTADDVDRELMEAHLEGCERCARDADDLRTLRAELSPAHPAPRGARPRRWPAYAAIGALAAVLSGVFVWTGTSRRTAVPAPRTADAPAPAQASAPPAAAPRLTLKDGGRTLTLQHDGTVSGLPLRAAESEAVRLALDEGRLPPPPSSVPLAGAEGTLMAAPARPPAVRLLRPIATAVEADRPLFEWTTLAGAATCLVSVFDEEFEKVAESPPLTAGRWQPPTALARGRTYQWQVRAATPAGEIVAPSPPSREARFHVLSQADADRLAEMRERLGDSSLALGILLAGAGVLDAAEDALARGAAANPDSPVPLTLLNQLRDQRMRPAGRR